jgi:transcriptional regulator GlxA family with amidase domain
MTPLQWILRARVDRARELLEQTDVPITEVASRTGLGSDANLRRHFGTLVGTSPTAYRDTFRRLS